MKVIGHRGAAGLEPENTLLSFKKALELGIDEVEMDVLRSKDGHLVVIHDNSVDRTTNGKGKVRQLTLSELKKLDAGKGQAIPTLQEVFDLIKETKADVTLNVEIKKPGYEEDVIDLIQLYGYQDRTYIISRRPKVLRQARALSSRIKTALIIDSWFFTWFLAPFLNVQRINPKKIAKRLKVDRISIRRRRLTEKLVAKFHQAGFEVTVWTINRIKYIERMTQWGVDGICSDYPDRVMQILKSRKIKHKRQ